jgi:hypothetical protein
MDRTVYSLLDEFEDSLNESLGGGASADIDKMFSQSQELGKDIYGSVLQDIDIPEMSRRGPAMLEQEFLGRFDKLNPQAVTDTVRRVYKLADLAKKYKDTPIADIDAPVGESVLGPQLEMLASLQPEDKELFKSLLANLQQKKPKKGWLGTAVGAEGAMRQASESIIQDLYRFGAGAFFPENNAALDEAADVNAIRQELNRQAPTGLVQEAVFEAAGMVPDIAASAGVMGAGAIAGGPAGAAAATAANLQYWTARSAPEIMDGLRRSGVDRDLAAQAGLIGGTFVASVELMQFKGIAKPFIEELKREVILPTTMKIVGKSSIGYGKEGLKQIGEELTQQFGTEATKAITRWMVEKDYSQEEIDEVIASFGDTARQTALSMPLILLPGAAFSAGRNIKEARELSSAFKESLLDDEGVFTWSMMNPQKAEELSKMEPTRANFMKLFDGEDFRWTKEERQQFKEMVSSIGAQDEQDIQEVPAGEKAQPEQVGVQLPEEKPQEPAGKEAGLPVLPGQQDAQAPEADAERVENDPPLSDMKDAETGVPVTLWTYRGSGRSAKEIYSNAQVPILGEGHYVAPNYEDAKQYGGSIERKKISLANPLVIRNDSDWRALTREAGWEFSKPVGVEEGELKEMTGRLRDLVLSKGHDGIVAIVKDVELTHKTMLDVFGHTQAVVYQKDEKKLSPGAQSAIDALSKAMTGPLIDIEAEEKAAKEAKKPAKEKKKKVIPLSERFKESPDIRGRIDAEEDEEEQDQQLAILQSTIPVSLDDALQLEEDPVSTQEILMLLHKAFEIDIRKGRLVVNAARALGIYQRHPEIARLKGSMYGDISVTTHEVAHHIDKKTDASKQLSASALVRRELISLDYMPGRKNQKVAVQEGFAEFIRYYVTDPANLQKYPSINKAFELFLNNNPAIKENLNKVRDLVTTWRAQGSIKRGMAQIVNDSSMSSAMRSINKPAEVRKVIAEVGDYLYTKFKNSFHMLDKFGRKAEKRGYKGLKPGELAQVLSMTSATFAQNAIDTGVIYFERTEDGNWLPRRFKTSLKETLMQFPTEQERADLSLYAVSRRAVDAHLKGINPGISETDARNNVMKLHAKYGKKIKDGAAAITTFNNDLVRMMQKVGVITEKEMNSMLSAWPNYVPLRRVDPGISGLLAKIGIPGMSMQDRATTASYVNQAKSFQKITGSSMPILDPITATIQRTIEFYDRAHKQIVVDALVNIAKETEGMNEFVQVRPLMKSTKVEVQEVLKGLGQVGEDMLAFGEAMQQDVGEALVNIYRPDFSPSKKENIVRVMIDGEPKLVQIDPSLYRTLSAMDNIRLPFLLDFIFGAPARLVKLGGTGISTGFAVMNPIPDFIAFLAKTKTYGADVAQAVAPPAWIAKYAWNNAKELWTGEQDNPYITLYKTFGGEMNHFLGTDINKIKRAIEMVSADSRKERILGVLTSRARIFGKSIRVPQIDGLRAAIGVSEAGPRLAEFSKAMRNAGYDPDTLKDMLQRGEYPPMDVLVDAMLKAADVTTNFKRLGDWGRYINHIIPYWNSRFESVDSMIRSFRDNPRRAAVAVSMLALQAALYWWARKDDDDYKEAEDWLRYGYWTWKSPVTGHTWKIKKPHEYGWLISSLVESMLDKAFAENPKAVSAWFDHVLSQIDPIEPPALFAPAMEVGLNQKVYGGWLGSIFGTTKNQPIEGRGLETRLPVDRYYKTTSELAKMIAARTGITPVKIDHMLNAYTGGIIGSVDRFGKGLSDGFTDFSEADVPFLKGFAVRNLPSKSVRELYVVGDESDQTVGSMRFKAKEKLRKDLGRQPTDEEVEKATENLIPDDLRRRKQIIDSAKRQISDLRDAGMSMKGKEFMDNEAKIIGIARQALGKKELASYVAPRNEDRTRYVLRVLTLEKPLKKDKQEEWLRLQEDAMFYLRHVDMEDDEIMQFYKDQIGSKTKDIDTKSSNMIRLRRALKDRSAQD